VNLPLYWGIWRRNWAKVLAVTCGLAVWGFLAPVIYKSILGALKGLPKGLQQFGSGDLRSFPGVVTVMFEHPLVVAIACTIAVAITVPAVAGQLQRGTLELLLARPIGRTTLIGTSALAVLTMLLISLLAMVIGIQVGAAVEGLNDQLSLGSLVIVWMNAVLLYAAFAAFALAASSASNRTGPAVAGALAFVIINYFLEVLGGFWDVAKSWQPYSLFHHFNAGEILTGGASIFDFWLLAVAAAIPLLFALYYFQRRDLPAPG
jgi:ABC-2 type transport system permease protein